MEEEKVLIRRIKYSLKSGRTRAQITQSLQQKGLRLPYIDALIRKAKRPKKVLITLSTLVIVLISLSITTYALFLTNEKQEIQNPLSGLNINFASKNTTLSNNLSTENQGPEVFIEDIKITPEFISYLLNELNAWKLHTNPLTFEKPTMNFKIDNTEFQSTVKNGEISTQEGLSAQADLQFNTNKEELIKAMLSENPEEIFRQSISEGKTQIQILGSQTELFAKGYKELYDNLK